jgi:hypothetical protein
MGFATAWLDKNALSPELFREKPDDETGIIAVIPAYNEPEIATLLDSLAECDEPDCRAEVLIIVNAPPGADTDSLLNNRRSVGNIESWKKKNTNCFFRLFIFDAGQPAINGWGAGLARKTGMDEALRRFDRINKQEGVIVSLDADCKVGKNYFTAICNDLLKKKDRSACSIYFEHPVSGRDFNEDIYRNITLYELHLRYYIQGLKYSHFPYSFHTIGSAFAFRAVQYVRAGGMNRKQAGEDFYFIQKLVPLEGYFSLNSTTVFPSPRESFRVPFGTGPAMGRLMENGEGKLLTYNIDSFRELHSFFTRIPGIFCKDNSEASDFYYSLPPGLKSFVDEEEWADKIQEIKANTSAAESFSKRFYSWFNMFRIVKYLNHVHKELFEKQDVADAACRLLTLTGHHVILNDPGDLLLFFRSLGKS